MTEIPTKPPDRVWEALATLRHEDPVYRFVRDHTAWAIAAAITATTLVRVFAVAHGNPDVVQALLTYADPSHIVLASLAALAPALVATIALVAVMVWVWPPMPERRIDGLVPWVLVGLVVLVTPWTMAKFTLLLAVAILVFGGAEWLYRRWRRRRVSAGDGEVGSRSSALDAKSLTGFWIVAIGIVVGLLALNDRPWVMSEDIVIRGNPVSVGYVIGTSGAYDIVMWHDDRVPQAVPEEAIESRIACRLVFDYWDEIPLFWRWKDADVNSTLEPCRTYT